MIIVNKKKKKKKKHAALQKPLTFSWLTYKRQDF